MTISIEQVKHLLVTVRPDLAPAIDQVTTWREVMLVAKLAGLPKQVGSVREAVQVESFRAAEEYKIELTACGDNALGCIKAVRAITNVTLRDAKDIVDQVRGVYTPKTTRFICWAFGDKVRGIVDQLREAGGVVQVTPLGGPAK